MMFVLFCCFVFDLFCVVICFVCLLNYMQMVKLMKEEKTATLINSLLLIHKSLQSLGRLRLSMCSQFPRQNQLHSRLNMSRRDRFILFFTFFFRKRFNLELKTVQHVDDETVHCVHGGFGDAEIWVDAFEG